MATTMPTSLREVARRCADGSELDELVTDGVRRATTTVTKLSGARGEAYAPGEERGRSRPGLRRSWPAVEDHPRPPEDTDHDLDSEERTSIVEYDPNGNLRRLVNPRGVNQNTKNAETASTAARTTNDNLVPRASTRPCFRYGARRPRSRRAAAAWNGRVDKKYRRLFHRTDNDPDTVDALGRLTDDRLPARGRRRGSGPRSPRRADVVQLLRHDWVRSIVGSEAPKHSAG